MQIRQGINLGKIGFVVALSSCIFVAIQTCSLSSQIEISNRQIEYQLEKDRLFITAETRYQMHGPGKIYEIGYIFVNRAIYLVV